MKSATGGFEASTSTSSNLAPALVQIATIQLFSGKLIEGPPIDKGYLQFCALPRRFALATKIIRN